MSDGRFANRIFDTVIFSLSSHQDTCGLNHMITKPSCFNGRSMEELSEMRFLPFFFIKPFVIRPFIKTIRPRQVVTPVLISSMPVLVKGSKEDERKLSLERYGDLSTVTRSCERRGSTRNN